jgi:hypothetical protein
MNRNSAICFAALATLGLSATSPAVMAWPGCAHRPVTACSEAAGPVPPPSSEPRVSPAPGPARGHADGSTGAERDRPSQELIRMLDRLTDAPVWRM